MSIDVISEGQTEEKVIDRLRLLQGDNVTVHPGKGKGQINRQIRDILGPKLPEGVRCLVLRDWDEHEGETSNNLVQSVSDALRRMLSQRDYADTEITLKPHADYANVYTLTLLDPDVRLALHIATYRWHEQFIKSTMDDCVLKLALYEAMVSKLLTRDGRESWSITPQQIINKVTIEIPDLIRFNGIPLREAKDYVRLYAATLQMHTSPPVFAARTLIHAEESDLRQVFASLLAAIAFIRG